MENCLVCGNPVQTQYPGLPRARALCDDVCKRIWAAQTGKEYVSIQEYARRVKTAPKPIHPTSAS